MVDLYNKFAKYYDLIYSTFYNYKKECDNLKMIFEKYSIKPPKNILDVGCGTGTHALELSHRGYSVTGLDISKPMIDIANKKVKNAGAEIEFLVGDMREINMDSKFDTAVCFFGGFNYLLTREDQNKFFRGIKNCLKDDSLLSFEYWNTMGVIPGFRSWDRVENKKENSTIVRLSESKFDSESEIVTVTFNFYVFKKQQVIDEFTEVHELRSFHRNEIEKILNENGFDIVALYDKNLPQQELLEFEEKTFNIFVVARKK